MASGDILNFEELLAPIPGEKPGGENLRWDPIFDEIRAESRREQNRDAIEGNGGAGPDWTSIIDKASDALERRSKDLNLAGYLLQALVQEKAFAGLRDGLRLLNGLLESFWDNLYPEVDDGDLGARLAPLLWVTDADAGGRIANRVREIPLVAARDSDDDHSYSWAFWKSRYVPPKGESEDEDAFERRRAEAEERAKLFEDTVTATPLDHFTKLYEDIEQALSELSRFGAQVDEKFGDEAPGTTALRQSLDDATTLVRRIIKDKGGFADLQDDNAATDGEEGEATGESRAASGPIKSRADALRRLVDVAEFFRRSEPHSPVSYLVQRAATWANMPLEQLLGELVKDQSVREQIDELLGLRRSGE